MRTVMMATGLVMMIAPHASGDVTIHNSPNPAGNGAALSAWLADIGITVEQVQHFVDFESGFVQGQNVSGNGGLFPGGLVITDSSSADEAVVTGLAADLGGSNPIDSFGLAHNEQAFLELDFTAQPVDYVSFYDIDHAGTSVVIHFEGGGSESVSIETTGSGNNIYEFFGILRNDMPRITRVQLDASGDGKWGIDNIRYGRISECVGDIVTSRTFQPPPDGFVDAADLAFLLGAWGANPGSAADFVSSATFQPPPDGVVDGADLAVLLGAWGACR